MGMTRRRLDDWYEGHLYMAMQEKQAAEKAQEEMMRTMGVIK